MPDYSVWDFSPESQVKERQIGVVYRRMPPQHPPMHAAFTRCVTRLFGDRPSVMAITSIPPSNDELDLAGASASRHPSPAELVLAGASASRHPSPAPLPTGACTGLPLRARSSASASSKSSCAWPAWSVRRHLWLHLQRPSPVQTPAAPAALALPLAG